MNTVTRLTPLIVAAISVTILSGCRSTPEARLRAERIEAFEVKLTTARQENAGATVRLALIVECESCSEPFRLTNELGKATYKPGQTRTIKVKAHQPIPWIERNRLAFHLSTQSDDAYLPSHVWIASVSSTGERFTQRNAAWTNKMFSVEKDDPEAVPPVASAAEWVVTHDY